MSQGGADPSPLLQCQSNQFPSFQIFPVNETLLICTLRRNLNFGPEVPRNYSNTINYNKERKKWILYSSGAFFKWNCMTIFLCTTFTCCDCGMGRSYSCGAEERRVLDIKVKDEWKSGLITFVKNIYEHKFRGVT